MQEDMINLAVWVLVGTNTAKMVTDVNGKTIFWREEEDMRAFANGQSLVYELEFYYCDENQHNMVEYEEGMRFKGIWEF